MSYFQNNISSNDSIIPLDCLKHFGIRKLINTGFYGFKNPEIIISIIFLWFSYAFPMTFPILSKTGPGVGNFQVHWHIDKSLDFFSSRLPIILYIQSGSSGTSFSWFDFFQLCPKSWHTEGFETLMASFTLPLIK